MNGDVPWRVGVSVAGLAARAASVSVTSRFAWLGNAVGIATGNGQTSVKLVRHAPATCWYTSCMGPLIRDAAAVDFTTDNASTVPPSSYTDWSLTACLLAAFIGKASCWCSTGHFLFGILSTFLTRWFYLFWNAFTSLSFINIMLYNRLVIFSINFFPINYYIIYIQIFCLILHKL